MFEYTSLRSSAYDVEGLISQLNSSAGDGWEVVSIVPAGGELAAIMRRESTGITVVSSRSDSEPASVTEVITPETATVAEPPGWAASIEPVSPSPTAAASPDPSPSYSPSPAAAPTPVVEPVVTPPVQQPAPVSATPAGWYPDPSGRFEMRYWDGNTWTEHVARNGQQFTDAPVA